MYILINSGPFTLRKFNEHSVATAFANNVCKSQREIMSRQKMKKSKNYYAQHLPSLFQEDHREEHLSASATLMKTNLCIGEVTAEKEFEMYNIAQEDRHRRPISWFR